MNYKKQLQKMRQSPKFVYGFDSTPPLKKQEVSFEELSKKRKEEAIIFMRENYKTNLFFEGEVLKDESDESIIEWVAPHYLFNPTN